MYIPENAVIFINLFIIALYVILMIIGYNKGFLYQVVNMAYTLAALAVAWFVSPVLAEKFPLISIESIDEQYKLLNSIFNLDKLLNTAAYFIIVFLLLKIIYIFISMLTKVLNKIPVLGSVNKFFGLFIGFINATIIVLALSMLLNLPLFSNGQQIIDKTFFKYIKQFTNEVIGYISEKIVLADENIDGSTFDVDAYRDEFSSWLDHLSNNE